MAKFTLDANIRKGTPLHDRLVKKIKSRIALAEREQQKQHYNWSKAEDVTMAYMPEASADSLRRSRRESAGVPTYTTIQIPYTYAVLMSAHTYWTSVFFARSPVHQFSGRHGEGEMQVQAMEALIGYQVEVGRAMVPYYVWLYDAGKYGVGIIGTYWDKQKLHYGQLVELVGPDGQTTLNQVTQEIDGYQGNTVYNVSPWDFLPDPRVSVKNFQKGEFVAIRTRLGWNNILRRRDSGYFNSNIDFLYDHIGVDKGKKAGTSQLETPQFTAELDEEVDPNVKKHPAGGVFYEFYVELVPKEWGVGDTNFPQKWCFTITEDCGLIVGASPLSMVHCRFPFDVLESEIEGYGSYARGQPTILDGVQNTVDWLINSHFFNVRQTMNNQFIVDPSKLVVKDMKNSGPGFVWRLRPEAYGSDLDKIFKQVPVQDVTAGHLRDFQAMLGLGERITGVNDQIMGAMNTGSRKTATEVRTSTSFGVNRQKTITEYMSAMGMAPHAQMLVQNSQQNYNVEGKLRRVGTFAKDAGELFLNVGPKDIQGFYDLIPVDGALPVDRMAQATLWKEVMAGIRNMPSQVAMEYDWGRIFAWVANLGGLRNIQQFKLQAQVVPDAQIADQAARGNVIPLSGPGRSGVGPGSAMSNTMGLNQMGGESAAGAGPVI